MKESRVPEPQADAHADGGAMPEMARERMTLTDAERFRGVTIIAAIVCGLAGGAEGIAAASALIKMQLLTSELGGNLPLFAQLASDAGPVAFGVAWVVFAAAIFFLFYWLAKKYWVGLLFVPVFVYWAASSIVMAWLAIAQFSVLTAVQ